MSGDFYGIWSLLGRSSRSYLGMAYSLRRNTCGKIRQTDACIDVQYAISGNFSTILIKNTHFMCKKVHNACICGFFFVSLRSLTLRFVMSRDLVAS